MTTFSSLEAAQQCGFQYYDFHRELQLYIVIRERTKADGRRLRELALASPSMAGAPC